MSMFFPTNGFRWIVPKDFAPNKYSTNSSKGCGLKLDFEYPKELCQLHNDYPLVPSKIGVKGKILPNEQEYQISKLK